MLDLKRVCEDLIKDQPFNDLNMENLQSISQDFQDLWNEEELEYLAKL